MNKQIPPGAVAAIVVVFLVLIVAIGYKYLGSPQRDVSPKEQVEMMRKMKQ